jgi:hypothetical protein
MPTSVAVRTKEIAFGRLGDQSVPRTVEVAQRELFCRRIAMVKLERGDGGVVAAVLTMAPTHFDEFSLSFQPALSLIAIPGISAPLSPIGVGVVTASDRLLRGVVSSEGRAFQTEFPSIERPQFSVNDLLCREFAAALLTNQRSQRTRRIEARTVPRLERKTPETLPSSVQVATLAVDDRVVAER